MTPRKGEVWLVGAGQISYGRCEDIKSVSEQRLIGRVGIVSEEAMFQIRRA